jgi:hypothetical protein
MYSLGSESYVSVAEGTYDTTTSKWVRDYAQCSYSDYVDLWYYSGMRKHQSGMLDYDDYLPHDFAIAIAYMATARLERVFYANNNATSLADDLMVDYGKNLKDDGFRYQHRDLNNPFGTKFGEIKAWQTVSKLKTSTRGGAIL